MFTTAAAANEMLRTLSIVGRMYALAARDLPMGPSLATALDGTETLLGEAIEAARALGCDATVEEAEDALRVLNEIPPSPDVQAMLAAAERATPVWPPEF